MPDVLVLGAVNQDLVVRVARRPGAGETLVGSGPAVHDGGKGANQAVAAARAGATTAFVGSVGDDGVGDHQLAALRREGVDTSAVAVVPGVPSGVAMIVLTADGENSIVVGPGANDRVDADQVRCAWEQLGAPRVALGQTEVPPPAVDALAELAATVGARLVVNAAPVRRLAAATLGVADPLVVNEHEAAELVCAPPDGTAAPAGRVQLGLVRARQLVARLGCVSAVVTLGPDGAALATSSGAWHVGAPPVRAVDTTGAGDAFTGTLAAELARASPLLGAVRAGVAAGALAVTGLGARSDTARSGSPAAAHAAADTAAVTSHGGEPAPAGPAPAPIEEDHA